MWSPFNKERMSHLCDSTVAGPTACRGNECTSKQMRFPPFSVTPFQIWPITRLQVPKNLKSDTVPLPTSKSSDSWIGNFARFADKSLCVSTESCDLLAESPVGMTD